VDLTHEFCTDDFSLFHTYAESYYADVYLSEQADWAYAQISSSDNYFHCYQQAFYTSGPLSCSATDDLRYNTDPLSTTVYIEGTAEFSFGSDVYDLTVVATWSPYSRHFN
jgi:hypothetical protein